MPTELPPTRHDATPPKPAPGRPLHEPKRYASTTPVAAPGQTYTSVTDTVTGVPLRKHQPWQWLAAFAVGFLLTMVMLTTIVYLLAKGVGIWGVNIPVAWGFAIINFVWWIGIGHAGTFISAMLLLMRQEWRTSINRFAEAMTLFAVACAGMMPLLHPGRPWMAYYLFPYPNSMGLWPQFRSPLVWDVFAVSTYGLISLVFWYVGLVPDLAATRDRLVQQNRGTRAWVYGLFALGWRGSARHWHRYRTVYLILGGLAAPLVISVHSIVGLDFTIAILPGWHSTIFPPYFVAGAIFSGFAMVLTLVIPIRTLYGLEGMITMRHIELMAQVMLVNGLIVGYGYLTEGFMAWYSADTFEQYMMANRMFGPYAHVYWIVIGCNVVVTQSLWFPAVRRNLKVLWVVAILVNVGMWSERYMIVVTSLSRDFLPSSWGSYAGTFWDWSFFLGTLGFFLALVFLFVRFLPMISMAEMRELVHEQGQSPEEKLRAETALDPPGGDGASHPTASPYTHEETAS